ncbi:alpha/beta-hydrolase [Gymnopus androsaceus JB14]|uniref:triacylglycerol lipase n=1 Tax=Gymnopus androsaceus JB14 TaxID=1447944 RepID=A0A6A4HPL0_9AGAR|nr:alpha/beta-hydrolase [Gymnopus androsaceus JB14]
MPISSLLVLTITLLSSSTYVKLVKAEHNQVPFTHHHQLLPAFPIASSPSQTQIHLKTRPTAVYRPRSLDTFHKARKATRTKLKWDVVHLDGPDVENLHTLAQLGRMSGNAYALPGQKDWYGIDPVWNISFPFGYEDAEDGFRGHVFLSQDNSTVVLSIKGTTLQGPTSKKDKYNDNLLFSCCCARVDLSWVFNQVCDCYAHNWRCDNKCLSDALIEDSLFYTVGVNLVNDLLMLYPTANLWLVGHSLGGALASLLGSTYGLPAVTFESPRDPIPQGACTGFGSPCAQAGYALETRCHLGKGIRIRYCRTHSIKEVITKVLEADGVEWEDGREVPEAKEEIGCVDCYKWEFGDFKGKTVHQKIAL